MGFNAKISRIIENMHLVFLIFGKIRVLVWFVVLVGLRLRQFLGQSQAGTRISTRVVRRGHLFVSAVSGFCVPRFHFEDYKIRWSQSGPKFKWSLMKLNLWSGTLILSAQCFEKNRMQDIVMKFYMQVGSCIEHLLVKDPCL